LNKNYTLEPITAEVINLGTDTVKGFNLAYSVNGGNPVAQYFTSKVRPGDTAVVAFSSLADLAGNGTYLVKVYGYGNNDEYLKNDTSSIVIVNTAITPVENPENKLKIMPNPFRSSFMISLPMDNFDEVTISIFDPAGKVIWEENRGLVSGENNITITPGDITSGFYVLKIRGKTVFKAARLIKR
jgi:hypothetical protein